MHPGLSRAERRALKEKLRETVASPQLFAQRILRHNTWATQRDILTSVAQNARTAVKACHASSKTFTAAEAVLWWVTAHDDGIALTTAPTWTQVERMMWGEIRKSMAGSLIRYPEARRTELRLKESSEGDEDTEENFALGISTNQGVRFQGWHGKILVVIDEAVGVRADIFEAIEGIRAGGDVRILMLGNPTVTGGYFYDSFTTASAGWSNFTISGLNTPNTDTLGHTEDERLAAILERGRAGDEEFFAADPRPYLIRRHYIWEKWNEWGPGSPLFEARVLGQFPSLGATALFPLAWIERALGPAVLSTHNGAVTAGVDVAGPGEDETVVTVRGGDNILTMQGFAGADPRGQVLNVLRPYKDTLELVNVDTIGMGYYFARHLADQGLPVQDINVSETAYVNRERYANLKAQLHWGLRERLQEGRLRGLNDERTRSQLSSIQWGTNAQGQIVVESKEALARRGVKSPDRAESLVLAFAPRLAPTVENWFPAGGAYTSIT